jgi:hypothetical protein
MSQVDRFPLSSLTPIGKILLCLVLGCFLAPVRPAGADFSLVGPWTGDGDQTYASYGYSASTAGDVNGDGFSDIIVGARGWDGVAGLNAGRAYVYFGTAGGVHSSVDWSFEAPQSNTFLGSAVAPAGDVNGDGYDDILVGAPYYDAGYTDSGRAYLFLGGVSGPALTPSWTYSGTQTESYFGQAISTAGDVNDDGYDDVVVSAPSYDGGQTNEGRVYLFLGSATGLSSTPVWTKEIDSASARFGNRVATAGDVNGDGHADVVIGAIYYDPATEKGKVFVYLGTDTGLAALPVWSYEGTATYYHLGRDVGTAGDVNGDGYSDVIVSTDIGGGWAYVFHGNASGVDPDYAWRYQGGPYNHSYGYAAATAGDVNADGYADVVVSDPGYADPDVDEGTVYLYYGSSSGLSTSHVQHVGLDIADSHFGSSIGTAGDVNGDGMSDLIVGAPVQEDTAVDEGYAYVFYADRDIPAMWANWADESNQAGANFASSLASGDFNGDGYSDLVAGAPAMDAAGTTDGGAVSVYYGSSTGTDANPEWSHYELQSYGNFGASVACAGDVNGDGYDDLLVAAPRWDGGQTDEGHAMVFLGSSTGLEATASWTVECNEAAALFGTSVSGAGDVNGDGYADVIIGAPGFPYGISHLDGAAFVYLGSSGGLATSPAWITHQGDDPADYGISVAGAGDVNGDGYSDVIVGGPLISGASYRDGAAYVYHGSAIGLSTSPATTLLGRQANGNYGVSVASAGDVNGDGYSDVVIGADQYDDGETDEGMAAIYLGSPSGISATAIRTFYGNEIGANFGAKVAGGGDTDADGNSEIVVGAPGSEANEGRVYLFLGSATGPSQAPWVYEGLVASSQLGLALSSAGDLTGDGFCDLLFGAPFYSNGQTGEGRAVLYYGNGQAGLERTPRQLHLYGSPTPIAVLGVSDNANSFRLRASGRTPGGRGQIRLEYEVKPFGSPFTGPDIVEDWIDTGAPTTGNGSRVLYTRTVTGLLADNGYIWRLRFTGKSVYFPRSIWFTPAGNARREMDLRTKRAAADAPVAEGASGSSARFTLIGPNPCVDRVSIGFVVPRAGPVKLSIHEPTGRCVAVLVDREMEEGAATVEWLPDRGTEGRLPSGIYFARLSAGAGQTTTKLILLR